MRALAIIAAASLFAACAHVGQSRAAEPAPAVKLAPGDSALASGNRVQFFRTDYGWLDGFLIRWTAAGPCIGVYAPDLRGGFVLREIDSLRVDPGVGFGLRPPATRAAMDSLRMPPPAWRSVSVAAVLAQEPRACTTL